MLNFYTYILVLNMTTLPQIPDLMYYADTIHDMYPVSNSSRGENIRPYLNKIMNPTVETYLQSNTGGKVTASNIEHSTEKYIEEILGLPNIKNNGIKVTYSDIMKDYKKGELLNMVETLRGDKDVLVISGIEDNNDIQKDLPERNYIANFILNFFISDYKNQNVGFSFDASKGKLPYIFWNITQCRTCNTALTYVDSANTSDSISLSKLNQTDVIFPQDGDNCNENYVFSVTSNHFTKNRFQISYTSDTVYNYKNPYAIALNVRDIQSGNVYKSYFNSINRKNGTSVGDIKQIILPSFSPKFKNMLKIDEITNNFYNNMTKELFLYDYKRSGDYEQVNAMKCVSKNYQFSIFSSIDILCVLYARVNGINCIRTQGGNLYLYRFTTTEQTLSPEIILNKKITNIKLKCRRLVKLIELLGSDITNFDIQIQTIDYTIGHANNNRTLETHFINKLLIINLELVKNKLINILGSGSLISGIRFKVQNILNEYETNQGKINTIIGTDSIYNALIKFLNNFIDTNINDLDRLIQNNKVLYRIDGNNESILIDMENFIEQFEDDQSDVYEEIITGLDKLYKNRINQLEIEAISLTSQSGLLFSTKKSIKFPEFTTENFIILNNTIKDIKDMLLVRRQGRSKNNLNIFILRRDKVIKELNTIIKNIESLDSTIGLELKSIDINILYEITEPVSFITTLEIIEREINRIFTSLQDSSSGISPDSSPSSSQYSSPSSPQYSSPGSLVPSNPYAVLGYESDGSSQEMIGGAGINNPEFYFELNELFISITRPLRNIIDSVYSINNPIQNILTHMLDLKRQIDDIDKDTKINYTVEQKQNNKSYTWNRNINTINNLIQQHIPGDIGLINNITELNSGIDYLNSKINNSNYLEFIQKINNDNVSYSIIDEIHYLYAKWITEFDTLLYKNNIDITDIRLPKSLDLIGFMLSITSKTISNNITNITNRKRKKESEVTTIIDVLDERYESKLQTLKNYQNQGSIFLGRSNTRTSNLVEYNNIYTYYGIKLSSENISPEIITASIFAYLDYKIRDDILLFDFSNEVSSLQISSKLLTENEWELFYTNIAQFFANLKNPNKRVGGKTRRNKRNKKRKTRRNKKNKKRKTRKNKKNKRKKTRKRFSR